MANWRAVLGLHDGELDFDKVHMRYRDRILALPDLVSTQNFQILNDALEQARRELANVISDACR